MYAFFFFKVGLSVSWWKRILFSPNTNKDMGSKDNEYNPDENTNIVLKKGWGGRV